MIFYSRRPFGLTNKNTVAVVKEKENHTVLMVSFLLSRFFPPYRLETVDGEDLNRISEAELAAAKTQMDVMFQRNQLLPGERGYTHDVRKDFGEAEEDCDWDED